MMRVALLQLNVSDDPSHNLAQTLAYVAEAAQQGADMILTPEVTNCVSTNRAHQREVLQLESDDMTLKAMQQAAQQHRVWILIGSLALRTEDADGRFANRSFLLTPDGTITARYDKIHMFDVDVTAEETYRESSGYRPGSRAVLAETPKARIGMTVCYDVRFPMLYAGLARAGAQILTVPAAFSPVTGAAHWHTLLRARAIETGCFVLAPAQTGTHASARYKARDTFGHSLVVSPWGEILMDAEKAPGVYMADLDMKQVDDARRRVPSLTNARPFDGP
jgi:predicted amidohydrolase